MMTENQKTTPNQTLQRTGCIKGQVIYQGLTLLVKFELLLITAFLIVGCDRWFLDTYWRSGNFRLVAVDSPGQMALIESGEKGEELVGPTIYAVGSDERFVIVAQHPAKNRFGDCDKSVTYYYIINRDPDGGPFKSERVRGPLSKPDFDALSASLSLPTLTKVFNELK